MGILNIKVDIDSHKELGTSQCLLDPIYKDNARNILSAKDVWKPQKYQQEGQWAISVVSRNSGESCKEKFTLSRFIKPATKSRKEYLERVTSD